MALNPLLKSLVTQTAAKYKGGSSKAMKLKDGRNVIRLIVPKPNEVPWVGADSRFYRELGVHWIKAEENGKPLVVLGSEEICYDRISPISSAINVAIAGAYDEDSKKLYESWKAKRSIVVNVVSRDNQNSVEVLEMSPTTFGKIMDLANLYDDSDVDIFDHIHGCDIVITKNGKGLNTTYDVAVLPLAPGKSFTPVTADQVKAAANLDEWIASNFFRGEEQKALNAIAQIAGIALPSTPSISNMTVTPVAALTSAGMSVAPAASAPAPAAAPAMTPEQMHEEIRRQAAILVAQQQQQAAIAAASSVVQAPVEAAPVATLNPETGLADLSQSEQDRLLSELNAIGI